MVPIHSKHIALQRTPELWCGAQAAFTCVSAVPPRRYFSSTLASNSSSPPSCSFISLSMSPSLPVRPKTQHAGSHSLGGLIIGTAVTTSQVHTHRERDTGRAWVAIAGTGFVFFV